MKRPITSNADEWQLWLQDHADSGDAYKAVQIAEAIDTARLSSSKRIEELEKALERISRTPTMPFPDAGAHSVAAWGSAVYLAWKQIQNIARAALSPSNGGGEMAGG